MVWSIWSPLADGSRVGSSDATVGSPWRDGPTTATTARGRTVAGTDACPLGVRSRASFTARAPFRGRAALGAGRSEGLGRLAGRPVTGVSPTLGTVSLGQAGLASGTTEADVSSSLRVGPTAGAGRNGADGPARVSCPPCPATSIGRFRTIGLPAVCRSPTTNACRSSTPEVGRGVVGRRSPDGRPVAASAATCVVYGRPRRLIGMEVGHGQACGLTDLPRRIHVPSRRAPRALTEAGRVGCERSRPQGGTRNVGSARPASTPAGLRSNASRTCQGPGRRTRPV